MRMKKIYKYYLSVVLPFAAGVILSGLSESKSLYEAFFDLFIISRFPGMVFCLLVLFAVILSADEHLHLLKKKYSRNVKNQKWRF